MSATVSYPPMSWSAIDDIVIVGGGLAGLYCALKLAPRPVTVLAAAPIGQGASSAWAQAGIAAAVGASDSIEKHLADTLAAGAGLVDEKVARMMVGDACKRIEDLLSYGVPFDRDLEGRLVAAREAAHSEHRVIGVRGDMAGKAIMEAIVAAVRKVPTIRVLEGYIVEELKTVGRYVSGVIARPERGRSRMRVSLPTRAVILCSGGIGHLYNVTTNPGQAGGSGLGMAARAGAVIADPEFVQFHPTAIDAGRDPAPLATEALRGEGAVLVNGEGHRFMPDRHPLAELAPRDVVARGIFAEILADRGAFLDCRKSPGERFAEEFPTVYRYCRDAGIDPARDLIPVIPAAHYHMGGILTDADGRTSIDGLWAAGEVTSTGAHGANRLASNSLLEAVVFAGRVAEDIQGLLPVPKASDWGEPVGESDDVYTEEDSPALQRLRELMGRHAGVIRHREGLEEAARQILRMEDAHPGIRFSNMLIAAKMVVAGAMRRTESRGGHYRSDYPEPRAEWKQRTYLTLDKADGLLREAAEKVPA